MRKSSFFFLPLLWIGTFFSFVTHSYSQEQQITIDTLDFARFDVDTFAFDMHQSTLINFYKKLDSVVSKGEGSINILHLGASHVQAGVMSNRIREHIYNAYPQLVASRGLIFPYSIIPKSNNPVDYSVSFSGSFGGVRNVYKEFEKPLGVSGIAVFSTDTFAEINIKWRNGERRYATDSLIIFGAADSGSIIPLVFIDSMVYAPTSIDTQRHRFTYRVQSFCDSFGICWDADSGNHFTLSGIWLGNTQQGITFHSIGVNGASVSSYLNCVNFERDLEVLYPDMVIFGIGINDAFDDKFDTLEFERNYLLLAERIKNINPACAFVFITNNDSYKRIKKGRYAVNERGELARRVFYRLAAQTNGAVWDQFEIMGGLRSMHKWEMEKLAKKDKIHFTNAGYKLIADLFFNAWIDAKWKVNQFEQYKNENF